MTTYRSTRVISDKKSKTFFTDRTTHRKKCSCESDCDGSCRNSFSVSPQFDVNFSNSDATISQDADQFSFMAQESAELIWVKESCNIKVHTTDTQAGVSLQAGLQLAIALVLRITVGSADKSDAISQELFQQFELKQTNKQKIFICNTKDATVRTKDTDLAVNIQALLQILLALIVLVDIF
ncbi:spore coat protein [Oceanobacillus saliphilus]|uniref:spore coat protein n=1 Tax=Oceanobacillus saliphilus TaxID=2925834 RepID=UPI00201D6C40|nr:spore coat protein [Oceanobacillus saliphilus]